jgi:carboxymethylenebutenolidase
MSYRGQSSQTIQIKGNNGDQIEAYYARPDGPGPFPGVVVIHHMPGWDNWTCEVVRKMAHNGYAAIAPHLYSRHGPGSPDDLAAAARNAGGVSDDQVTGDVQGSLEFLRAQPEANGKVGVIGFCSGGRQSYMVACRLPFDAAVDCWGGGVIPGAPGGGGPGGGGGGGGGGMGGGAPAAPSAPRVSVIDLTPDLKCPILGIFGNEDRNPDPDQVNKTEEILKQNGKTYEFHRYDGAGHGFFGADRPGYRPEQAVDGWSKVFAWYEKYLMAPVGAAAK